MGAIVLAAVLAAGANDLLAVRVDNNLLPAQTVAVEQRPAKAPVRTTTKKPTRTRWGLFRRR
jgi:hypothetical protein